MRKSKSFFVLPILILMVVSIFLTGCGSNSVVAKYEGGEITEGEFKNFVKVLKTVDSRLQSYIDNGDKDTLELALNYMVMTRYVSNEVKENDAIKKAANDNLALYKKSLEEQMGGADKVKQYFTQQNVTDAEMNQFFLEQSELEYYFSNGITEDDKKKKYEAMKKDGALVVADVRHILIGTTDKSKDEAKKKAEQLVKQLRAGGDFAKLAKENSEDPGSKDNGGLYTSDQLPLSSTDPAFKQAALTLPINKISDPVESSFGYHIIRVEKRNELKYDDIANDLTIEVAKDRQNDFMLNKLKTITKKAEVPKSMIKEPAQQPAQ
ncbi:MAG TPA: hypothetical protein DDY49_03750 [Paenibacillaceae bacterium]|nr:hypothetical protein [Paenibacillaceae bacterium]